MNLDKAKADLADFVEARNLAELEKFGRILTDAERRQRKDEESSEKPLDVPE
jgi:hypothetical protein